MAARTYDIINVGEASPVRFLPEPWRDMKLSSGIGNGNMLPGLSSGESIAP